MPSPFSCTQRELKALDKMSRYRTRVAKECTTTHILCVNKKINVNKINIPFYWLKSAMGWWLNPTYSHSRVSPCLTAPPSLWGWCSIGCSNVRILERKTWKGICRCIKGYSILPNQIDVMVPSHLYIASTSKEKAVWSTSARGGTCNIHTTIRPQFVDY